jgi:hypothetical protein
MKFWSLKARTRAANALLIVYALAVVYSGFAYPLNYGRGFWPFNRDWFMFSYESGYDYELQALGETDQGLVAMDITPYFQISVASRGNRFQEVPRDVNTMRRLAQYLCGKFHVKSMTINEFTWRRPAGRRYTRQEVEPAKVSSSLWVSGYKCGS